MINLAPEFFDIFGFFAFVFIFITGIFMIKVKDKIPDWVAIALIIIGLLGLIVDGLIVLKYFIM